MNAVLVMESRGVTPGTRGFQFSDAWTRLYKTDDYYVDMSYVPGETGGKLQGQILKVDGELGSVAGTIRLAEQAQPIDDSGHFDIILEQSPQSLALELDDIVLRLDRLTL